MANKLNPFEEQLKKAANSFEAPYDASAWSRLESQLDKGAASGSSSLTNWFVAAIAIVAVGIGSYYFTQSSSTENTEPAIVEVAKTPENPVSQPAEVLEIESTTPSSSVDVLTEDEESFSAIDNETENVELNQKPTKTQIVSHTEEPLVAENTEVSAPKEESRNEAPIAVENLAVKVGKMEITTDKLTVCAGIEIVIGLTKPTNNTVVWNVNNGVSVPAETFVYTFMSEGKYIVTATNIETGVVSNELEIRVNPKPDASFNVSENIEQGGIPVVNFTANASGEELYRWSLGDGNFGDGEAISHTYSKAKDYEISLQVMNSYGCSWTSEERFTNDKEFNLLAPTSFSPNGDGLNDDWFPKALSSGYYKFELAIYNSHNRLVFSTSNPQEKWNGMVNGTNVKSNEFYIWKANVTDPNGIQQQYTGSILILF